MAELWTQLADGFESASTGGGASSIVAAARMETTPLRNLRLSNTEAAGA